MGSNTVKFIGPVYLRSSSHTGGDEDLIGMKEPSQVCEQLFAKAQKIKNRERGRLLPLPVTILPTPSCVIRVWKNPSGFHLISTHLGFVSLGMSYFCCRKYYSCNISTFSSSFPSSHLSFLP